MRVRPLLFVLASATTVACSSSNPTITDPGTDSTGGGIRGDAGQPDAGDGGSPDAGVPDAGNPCNTQALPGNVAGRDSCSLPGSTTPTTVTIIATGCNDVKMFLNNTGFNCSGVLTGSANAFNGTCSTIPCVSPSIPGTLNCTLSGGAPCTIQICADTTGTNCP